MKRNPSIDVFRGLSVILMVFFTLIARLSNSLPDFLEHGVAGTFHFGDLVLSFFIFASGISMAYFFNKRENNSNLIKDTAMRILILFTIWMFLSPISGGGLFKIDEIGLIAILFISTFVLHKLKDIHLILISLIILFSYFLFSPYLDFSDCCLGGYSSIIFYIPLILSGFILGRNLINNKNILPKLIPISLILFIISIFFFPIDKTIASPSFILISIFSASLLFYLISNYLPKLSILEYLGKKSIRYWVLMFVLFIIPLSGRAYFGELTVPMGFDTIPAILISIAFLILFALISLLIDKVLKAIHALLKPTSIIGL